MGRVVVVVVVVVDVVVDGVVIAMVTLQLLMYCVMAGLAYLSFNFCGSSYSQHSVVV